MAHTDTEELDATLLLQRISAGDNQAWQSVIRTYQPGVLAQGYRFGFDHELRQDLLQRVWLLLLEHADQIRIPAALPGWLATTARHEALRMLRQQRRVVVVDDPHGTLVEKDANRYVWAARDADPDAALIAAERAAELHRAIGELPTRQRALVVELMDDDRSYEEISSRLGMPVGSIGPTRMRALQALRRVLADAGRRPVPT